MTEQTPAPRHAAPGYNFGYKPKSFVDPEMYATTALPYKAAVRIVNVLEDLHSQMQNPQDKRFTDYPIADFEEIDTYIRDNMVNLALSLEMRSRVKEPDND